MDESTLLKMNCPDPTIKKITLSFIYFLFIVLKVEFLFNELVFRVRYPRRKGKV